MRLLKIILAFLFFFSVLFLFNLVKNATSSERRSTLNEKFKIEVKVKTESDLIFLKEIGLDCAKLGKCICLADSAQLLTLAKARYQFRPIREMRPADQQGIRQSRIFQVKLEINTQTELNFINSLGLNCADKADCVIEVNIDQVRKLKQNGISFSGIKEGIRVEGTSLAFKPAGSTYGRNDYVYSVPWVTWTYSPITIDNAPYDATVKELEVTYQIYDFDGQIYTIRVDLNNENLTKEHTLWNFEGYGYLISETEKDTLSFDGEPVNQTWKLYVWDSSDPGRSVIYPWSITLWFAGPPVYMVNRNDYPIPDWPDSVCSPITVNTAPATTRVTSIDVNYDVIHPYVGDLEIWLTDSDNSSKYWLWLLGQGGSDDDIHETVTGITDFNGELVNQTWRLWADDCYSLSDSGYIDFWSITLWYQDLPDLVIKSISPSNVNPMKNDIISVDMLVKNEGTRDADYFYTGLYYDRSYPPNTSSWPDQAIWSSGLASGNSQVVRFTGISSADTGTWDMYGLADCYGYLSESNEDNNYIGPKRVKWWGTDPKPDLVIAEAWVSNSCDPSLDESVYVDVVIKNIGGSRAQHNFGFYTDIFYNRPSAPVPPATGDDWHLSIGGLDPGQIETFSFVLPNPAYPETWKMWLLVDSEPLRIVEGNENNNVFGPIYVYWEAPPVSRRGPINRDQIINNAMKFVNVVWTCPEINRTRPFDCTTGPNWDSDYIIGVEYQGEPYEWGGWDIPGDINNPKCFLYYVTNNLKRAGSHAENDCQTWGDPPWATGVDCAGLVSRAWDIFYIDPNGYRSKPGVYTLIDSFTIELPDYYSLKRGDALISTCTAKDCGKHTFLFKDWKYLDTIQVIEARSWGTGQYRDQSRVRDDYYRSIKELTNDNYKPYKYKNVQETQDIIPGDANSDGIVSVSDIVYIVNYLFKGGPEPVPPCKADVNDDSKVTVSDVVYLVNYLFKGGPPLNNGCT